ncbi:MAG: peptidoglycan DD-metalloendopeptidase family protein, partial [Verrucomicrobiae bacterium]|nr:peptidoglycan DD-metalloendopeptidase family protein [Verrucomicrobiae bacterium]
MRRPSTLDLRANPTFQISVAVLFAALNGEWSSVHAESTVSYLVADGFDYPVGKPNAAGYRKARGFYPNGHLGEDWNGDGGGNTDRGDPIYAIGHGVVVYSDDFKMGWGNVVIIRHAYREKNGQIAYIDSLYGHL